MNVHPSVILPTFPRHAISMSKTGGRLTLTELTSFQGHIRGKVKSMLGEVIENFGGPGGTRTPNQAVMSGWTVDHIIVFIEYCFCLNPPKSPFVPLFQGQSGASQ